MKATVYFSVHGDLQYSSVAKRVKEYILECFAERHGAKLCNFPVIHTSRDFVHSSEGDKFNALYDSNIIVVLPNRMGIDEHQQFELKVWNTFVKLYNRPIYVILQRGTDYVILQAKFVEGRLREVPKLSALPTPALTTE